MAGDGVNMANFLIKLEPGGEVANQDAGLQSLIDVSDLAMAMGEADSFAKGHRQWGQGQGQGAERDGPARIAAWQRVMDERAVVRATPSW